MKRVVIEAVSPEVDGGRFPIKRIVGDTLRVQADLFADGHDALSGALLYRHESEKKWNEVPLQPLVNDRWEGSFPVKKMGRYRYTLMGWLEEDRERKESTTYERELEVVADRERARFSAWYELFPRSCAAEAGRHGTFRDVEERLPYLASLGFDVLYFPPIHPIAVTQRKGKNNALRAGPRDPGSPWAIGSKKGGHKSIHPELGTLEDFRRLVRRAQECGIEIALDIAFQCSPDHPYLQEHPDWFRRRPDGTIQFAENPPKKYEDIFPFDFETRHRKALWDEMKSIFDFWIKRGIRIFRVDNPHTKPFEFWEWAIGEIKREHPDVLFLSEAFTRPKVMMRLAKLGFSQSYTYFTWRTTRWELSDYFTELNQDAVRDFFRPCLWPNTPDILTAYLQTGGRPAFAVRAVLAATLSPSYGIYGPAFELCENQPREPGSEEYLNSEKYEIKQWDLNRSDSLKDLVARLNRIRRENPALQSDGGLRFHPVDNEQLLCYSKSSPEGTHRLILVVNLDPRGRQSGWVDLPVSEWGLPAGQPYEVEDLLTGARYTWRGGRNFVELSPASAPAHLFRWRPPSEK
jgi:starch synthase (maltosyl-transferring)